MLLLGRIAVSEFSDPAGIITLFLLFVTNGNPDPHSAQKTLVKSLVG